MRIALHPVSRQEIDPTSYVREFGHAAIGQDGHNPRPDAVCPFCGSGVYLAAEASSREPHFRHRRGAVCPSMAPAGTPYLPLQPGNPDPAAGERLRQAFLRNWRLHFAAVRTLAPCLSPEEFIELIDAATRHGIWDYVDFPEEDLPLAFLLLRDFPPWTGTRRQGKPERQLWLRYFFSPNVRNLNDLWIQPRGEVILHRASFKPPTRRNGRPAYEDLLKDSVLPIGRDFLHQEPPNLPNFIVEPIEAWLNRSSSFARLP